MLEENVSFELEELDDKIEYLLAQMKQFQANNCIISKTVESFSNELENKLLGKIVLKNQNVATLLVTANVSSEVATSVELDLYFDALKLASTTINVNGKTPVFLTANLSGAISGELMFKITASSTVSLSEVNLIAIGKGVILS